MLNPLSLIKGKKDGRYVVFAGHRRLAACKFAYPATPVGSGTATYRFRIDYDCATPPFDRNVCHMIVDRIENILRFVSQGNY